MATVTRTDIQTPFSQPFWKSYLMVKLCTVLLRSQSFFPVSSLTVSAARYRSKLLQLRGREKYEALAELNHVSANLIFTVLNKYFCQALEKHQNTKYEGIFSEALKS